MRNLILLCCTMAMLSCTRTPRLEPLTSKQTGIDFRNEITETDSFHIMSYEYIYNGAGVGVGDLNNDGMPDLVFAGNQVSPRVYLNEGDFRFRDITANLPGIDNGQWYSGVALVDINSDRWLDIYLTSTKDSLPGRSRNRLWINQGATTGTDPAFVEMAEQYGIDDDGQSVHAAFLDYDLDGDLDLYILTNTVTKRMNTSYRKKINDGTAQNNDRLYRNNGNGTFSNVTHESGINCEGFGLGVAVGDVNKDGYPDIYVTNDYISNELFYVNQGDGTFRNEVRKYMSYQSKSSMGNDMADVNNDGYLDMFTLDMMPEYYYKKKQTINGFSYIFAVNDAKYNYERQFLRNMLHIHNGFVNGEMLPFSEVGQMAGIYASEWSWSPLFADYDNDGDKDLIVANGYPRDLTDKDWTRYKAEVFGFVADEKHVINKAPAVKVNNVAYENTGELRFKNRTSIWLPAVPSYSYGASFVDLDNDGDLDYIANNIDDEAFIFRNNTVERSKKKANYIKVKLTGKEGNTMALGAKVELWCQGKLQYTEHFLSRGYASTVDPVIHFGLGEATRVDSIRVTWPTSRTVTVATDLAANQTLELDEKDARPRNTAVQPSEKFLFMAAATEIPYVHQQNDFMDFFFKQNIMPHKFSQIGPVIRQGDLDGDGQADLIIGATNVLPTTVLLQKNGSFVPAEIKGLTTKKSFVEADLAVVDIDTDGDMDVVVVAGGYENENETEYRHYVYLNEGGVFRETYLPVPPFPASVLKPCDFDKDGDTDLFVGSRVKKGMYPYANHSWMVLNDRGKLRLDSAYRFNLGMVTDAIWSDYDGDGWEDLLVAREWNSIGVLRNMAGKELVQQDIQGFEDHQGIWYSLAAGDFDGDGDDDYIAGNLGENHRFTVSAQFPMRLYAVDLDLDGVIDPVSTGYWKDQQEVMKEYPVNYLDELRAQTNFFGKKFSDYTSFSLADMGTIFDAETRERIEFQLQVQTTSSVILWNEGSRFTWEPLPRAAQVAPITRMIVRDFNGDGYPDVLVGGNDHTYDVSTGYYDANKGMVLLSKGKTKSFDLLTPRQSGIVLPGMVQSLLWIDGETPLVVAGINRGRVAVYELLHRH